MVTIAKETYPLPKPFFVMATENPLEVSGVYTLPEAQIDRFLFKLIMDYPVHDDEIKILSQNISMAKFEDFNIQELLSPEKIIRLQERVKKVFSSPAIKKYIVEIVEETRKSSFEYSKYISYGASPRASISLYIASKAEALMQGRNYVIPTDVKKIAVDVLRHRIILNYAAIAEKITPDKIIKNLLNRIKAP
jgi:MoxR-like ATPase